MQNTADIPNIVDFSNHCISYCSNAEVTAKQQCFKCFCMVVAATRLGKHIGLASTEKVECTHMMQVLVEKLLQRVWDKGDIYKAKYEGECRYIPVKSLLTILNQMQ